MFKVGSDVGERVGAVVTVDVLVGGMGVSVGSCVGRGDELGIGSGGGVVGGGRVLHAPRTRAKTTSG